MGHRGGPVDQAGKAGQTAGTKVQVRTKVYGRDQVLLYRSHLSNRLASATPAVVSLKAWKGIDKRRADLAEQPRQTTERR